MATTITINAGANSTIDLGDSNTMVISALGGTAEVYVDYESSPGVYSSAIKGSAGYSTPFNDAVGSPKTVNKSDLQSETIRVGAKINNISVTY